MSTRRFSFDTSAFLPHRQPAGTWERFVLEMTEKEEQEVFAKRDDIWEECNRAGVSGPGRRYDRWIVKRFSR